MSMYSELKPFINYIQSGTIGVVRITGTIKDVPLTEWRKLEESISDDLQCEKIKVFENNKLTETYDVNKYFKNINNSHSENVKALINDIKNRKSFNEAIEDVSQMETEEIFTTNEDYELIRLCKRGENAYRILFDPYYANNTGRYFFCNAAENYTHDDILHEVERNMWYFGNDRSKASPRFKDDMYNYDLQLPYLIFVPNNYNKNYSAYPVELGDDGYYFCAQYNFGQFLVRTKGAFDYIRLFKLLGQPERYLQATEKYNGKKWVIVITDMDTGEVINESVNEDFWHKKKYSYKTYDGKTKTYERDEYEPKNDSKYKRLCKKQINTLTLDEIKYIFAVKFADYMNQVKSYENPEDVLKHLDYSDDDFNKCYNFLHNLKFPLKIYRGIRKGNFKSSELNDVTNELIVSGKQQSYSWTPNINIYKNEKSKFKNLTDIVSAEIDSNIIDVPNTISNFMHYSIGNDDLGRTYGEYEITLKNNFKQSDLHNLQFVDKNVIEALNCAMVESITDDVAAKLGTTDERVEGPSYILPNGEFLKIWDANIDITRMSGNKSIHGKAQHLDVDGLIYKMTGELHPSYLLNKECIRVNNGLEEYVCLSKSKPTSAQYDSLLKWLDLYSLKHDEIKIMDYYGTWSNTNTYSFNEYTPDDLIKKIRAYYATGRLLENELSEKLISANDNGRWWLSNVDIAIYDSVYQAKNFLISCDEPMRVYISDGQYLIGNIFNITHMGMCQIAQHNGYNIEYRDRLNGDDVSLIYVPAKYEDAYFVEDYILSDEWKQVYIFNNCRVYGRNQDFSKTELAKLLGKYQKEQIK